MKKVILQKEIIEYLQAEIIRIRQKSPCTLTDIRNESYMNGYKEGQLSALTRVLTHLWTNY